MWCHCTGPCVTAAADYAHDTLHAHHVHLLGYSFGATVTGAALDARPFISTYTAVAYPLGHWWAKGVFGFGAKLLMHHHTAHLKGSGKPKLFLIGDNDDFTSKEAAGRRGAGREDDVRAHSSFPISHTSLSASGTLHSKAVKILSCHVAHVVWCWYDVRGLMKQVSEGGSGGGGSF